MRIDKDLLKHSANDQQQSASSTAHAMQQDPIALQVSRGPPGRSRTVKGGTTEQTALV